MTVFTFLGGAHRPSRRHRTTALTTVTVGIFVAATVMWPTTALGHPRPPELPAPGPWPLRRRLHQPLFPRANSPA